MRGATVVIPTYERRAQLRLCLEALSRQTARGRFEVIVVDDGSSCDNQAVIEQLKLKYPCRWMWQARDGFRAAKARNTGVLFAEGDIIVFLDDDMVAPPDFVESHLAFHAVHRETTAVGLRKRVPHAVWTAHADGPDPAWEERAVPDPRLEVLVRRQWKTHGWAYFNTCNASVPKRTLLDASLFDEAFVGWGFEDSELAYRLQKIGVGFEALLGFIPYHLEAAGQDMTGHEHRLALPEEKLRSYVTNGERFLGKYPDDEELRQLVMGDRVLRILVSKGDIPAALAQIANRPDPAAEAHSAARIGDRAAVPESLSLLTAFGEEQVPDRGAPPCEQTLTSDGPAEQAAGKRTTLLQELEREFGIVLRRRRKRRRVRFARWLWPAIASPLLILACVLLVGAMVLSGRYRRLFRGRLA